MIDTKDWNYKEMGFNSVEEMNESIERVKEQLNNPKSDIQQEIERRNEMKAELKANNNRLDTNKIREDVHKQDQDIKVHNRILYDQEQARLEVEREAMQELLKKAGESITADNEAKAQEELQKEIKKEEIELQKEMKSKYGVKTDKEKQLDDAYNKMLGD